MATKAELEQHFAEYHSRMERARAAERSGLYRMSIDAARSAWECIDGMMQYGRRYEQMEFSSVPAIEMVIRYAPLLFAHEILNELEALLKSYKRIDRNTEHDLQERLAEARRRMWENHRLWSHLERNPGSRQDQLRVELGASQEYWRSVAEAWEKMGLVERIPEGGSYCLSLATRLGKVVPAKCPSCGSIAEGPKAMFLEAVTCLKCRSSVLFVLYSLGNGGEGDEL